jgi:RNA recognition motif-containing protein
MFEKFGEIIEINVKSKAGSDHSYAFVEFKIFEEAEKAVSK